MWCYEDYLEEQRTRYELVPTRTGLWSIHDKVEHTYTLGMTLDEVMQYLKRRGIDINNVPICN